MKIVGFQTNEGLRLGVVEGEEVIDLQAVDKNAPADLGEWLRRDNGDLRPLKGVGGGEEVSARRAPNKTPPADLGEWLRRDNGDLSPLKDLARRAPASARRP